MHDAGAFFNRLRKNLKSLKPWLSGQGLEAFRAYDRDMPDLPLILDVYGQAAVLYDKSPKNMSLDPHLEELAAKAAEALGIDRETVRIKRRERQGGKRQYEKLGEGSHRFEIREGKLRFLVNLDDYLDTGLFLDMREVRRELTSSPGFGKRVLNLFCYTGSLSVAAASAGAHVTSVDLSNTYLEWARDNFLLNDLDPGSHEFQRADVLRWLVQEKREPKFGPFDLILLDPPTFSNSKGMAGTFDILRDHVRLIGDTMALLAPGGSLRFSTNREFFEMDPGVCKRFAVEEMTGRTMPRDFARHPTHKAFLIKRRS